MKVKPLTLILLFLSIITFSQEKQSDEQIEYLVNHKITSLDVIDSVFRKKRGNENLLKQLVKRSKEKAYLEGQFYGANSLGRYYRDRSFFNKSLVQYKKALHFSEKIKDTVSQLKTLNNIGSVYRRQDAIINGLNYHKRALDKALAIKKNNIDIEKIISVSQNSIGNIYNSLKQYNLALEEFNESIIVQKKINHKLGLAINYQNIGTAHEALGNLKEALENYSKSLDYNKQIDSKIGKIICGYSITNVLIKKGEYEKANKTVNAILPIAIKENDKFYLSNTYNTLGLSNAYLGKYIEAKKDLNIALDIAKKHNIQTIIVKANENLAFLYNKIGNHKKAYNHFKIAKEEDFKTFNAKNLIYVRDLITEYNKEKAENQIKDLAKKNKIAQLQISRIRNLWLLATSIIVIIVIIVFSIYRQKTLKREKKILSLKQDALRSQMNPHFIFNALNSIKLYIIENDKKKATSYLNKFSKLMRKILEGSTVQVTTLAEEIETMKLYMSIENIRFSNEIDFKVDIDSSLSLETIKIPPLVLQPFLENSLWHGLSSKKEDKQITIHIYKKHSEYIQIEISDNGIGRAASAKIKAKKSINRKSIGINLTKDRLTNFSNNLINNYSINYKDLKDKNNNTLGTKVIIKFPLF